MKLLIEERIKESGMKKSFIAEKLGVSNITVTRWIQGESDIRFKDAIRLAELLDIDITDLWED